MVNKTRAPFLGKTVLMLNRCSICRGLKIPRCGNVCDFLALGEAAGGANIGLQDIKRPVDQDRPKAPAGELGFAPGRSGCEVPT